MKTGLAIALMVSLAANVFLGGFVIGRVISGPPAPPPHAEQRAPEGFMLFKGLDDVSAESREAFRGVFKARRDALRESHHEARRLRAIFFEALGADPWDRARIDEALAELRAAERAQQVAFAETLVDAYETLSAAERRTLAEAAMRRAEKGPGEGGGRKQRRPGEDDEQ